MAISFICFQQRSEARILANRDDHADIQILMTKKIIERPSISSPSPPKSSPNSKQISEVSPHWANNFNKLALYYLDAPKRSDFGRSPKAAPPPPRPAPPTGQVSISEMFLRLFSI